MPMNISPYMIHHPFVNPDELPFPSVVLPGGGRLGIYPGLKTRLPGPGVGIGAGVIGMPHPLGGPLAYGCGTGIDGTAAAYRRYMGMGGMMLGRPCGYYLPGSTGLGGYFEGWTLRD